VALTGKKEIVGTLYYDETGDLIGAQLVASGESHEVAQVYRRVELEGSGGMGAGCAT
jgi:hypothetical protein